MKKRTIAVFLLAVAFAAVVWTKAADGLTFGQNEPVTSEPAGSPSPDVPEQNSPPVVVTPPSPSHDPEPEPSATNDIKKPPQPEKTPAPPPVEDKPASALTALLTANLPERTIKTNKKGIAVITNAASTFALVNKLRNLPADYVPSDLVVPDVPFSFEGKSPKKQLRKEAAKALETLFDAAKKDGIKLKAVSGYRSYATQKSIFESNTAKKGEEVANRTSARPGQSEHQTGLAMDVSSASVGYALEESFGDTKEGKWLAKHAAEYGFIIRYMKGKEKITGYAYEPWHIRFVGEDAAKDIVKKKLTLEEYFAAVSATLVK